MKAVRFVFALYILVLAGYPCSDGKTCLDEQRTESTVLTITDHDYKSAEQDLCSPFCICTCCAAHVQVKNVSYIDVVHPEYNTAVLTLYLEKAVLGRGNSIWQPPRA